MIWEIELEGLLKVMRNGKPLRVIKSRGRKRSPIFQLVRYNGRVGIPKRKNGRPHYTQRQLEIILSRKYGGDVRLERINQKLYSRFT